MEYSAFNYQTTVGFADDHAIVLVAEILGEIEKKENTAFQMVLVHLDRTGLSLAQHVE